MCPRKLGGEPPVPSLCQRRGHSGRSDVQQARALLAADESAQVLASLANGDDISSTDLPELHEHLACLAEEVDESSPTDNTPAANDTSEAFAGVTATVGLQSRGQRDPAFYEAFNDVDGLYDHIDDSDDDSHGTFGDFI